MIKKYFSPIGETCLSVEKEWLNNEIRKWNLPNFHQSELNSKDCTTTCSHQDDDSSPSARFHNADKSNQRSYHHCPMSLEENILNVNLIKNGKNF